jgi:hypothetical protein
VAVTVKGLVEPLILVSSWFLGVCVLVYCVCVPR